MSSWESYIQEAVHEAYKSIIRKLEQDMYGIWKFENNVLYNNEIEILNVK